MKALQISLIMTWMTHFQMLIIIWSLSCCVGERVACHVQLETCHLEWVTLKLISFNVFGPCNASNFHPSCFLLRVPMFTVEYCTVGWKHAFSTLYSRCTSYTHISMSINLLDVAAPFSWCRLAPSSGYKYTQRLHVSLRCNKIRTKVRLHYLLKILFSKLHITNKYFFIRKA